MLRYFTNVPYYYAYPNQRWRRSDQREHGLLRAMERKGVSVSFYKPIAQPRTGDDQPDLTSTVMSRNSDIKIGQPMSMSAAETLIGSEKMDVLLETVVERYNQINKDAEVTLIEGLVPTRKHLC